MSSAVALPHIALEIRVSDSRSDWTAHVGDVAAGAALASRDGSAGLHFEGVGALGCDASVG